MKKSTKDRLERLERRAGRARESLDAATEEVRIIAALGRMLEDAPDGMLEPPCVWKRPSEAGGLKPYFDANAKHGHGVEGDTLRGYFGVFSPEAIANLKRECATIAAEVRAGRIRSIEDLLDRLPAPVLMAVCRECEEADSSERTTEESGRQKPKTADAYERELRCIAAEYAELWRPHGPTVGTVPWPRHTISSVNARPPVSQEPRPG
jgi:hypothetical protein